MQYYYLSPGWEITPNGTVFELQSLIGKEIVRFAPTEHGVPDGRAFFDALKRGSPVKALLPSYSGAMKWLADQGVVGVFQELKINKVSSRYVNVLKNHCVGPGKIVNSVAKTAGSGIVACEATGFGSRFIQHQASLNYGWGTDSSDEMAEIKAIVECIERYALSDYDLGGLEYLNWDEAKAGSLTAGQLNTSVETLKNAGRIRWGTLNEIGGKGKIRTPIDFLYHPVDYWSLGRLPVCPMDISGIAGHQTKEAALVNALLELCEHEALMVTWFGHRVTPTIKPETLSQECQDHISALEKKDWRIIIKDISLDLVPVVMAVALGPKDKRALTIGSCAAFTTKYAARKAILEVARTVLIDEKQGSKLAPIKSVDVNDVLTHEQYCFDYSNAKKIEWLWGGDKEADANDLLRDGTTLESALKVWQKSGKSEQCELKYLLNIMRKAGLKAYCQDITPSEIDQRLIPLVVMRAVVPEMTRLVVGYGQKPAPTGRFLVLLKKFGSKNRQSVQKVHPFC